MGLVKERLVSFSLLVLGPPCCLAQLLVLLLTNKLYADCFHRLFSLSCTSDCDKCMKMRSQYIPEEARSTIMNFFRIPLNIFVCVVLYNVNAFPITVMFGMCSIFLFVASILQRRLQAIAEKPSKPIVLMANAKILTLQRLYRFSSSYGMFESDSLEGLKLFLSYSKSII